MAVGDFGRRRFVGMLALGLDLMLSACAGTQNSRARKFKRGAGTDAFRAKVARTFGGTLYHGAQKILGQFAYPVE
jgi:hypothetical protein